jgi:chemosensory pili system protein ChpA (sensor histidine kinase/response regulator)
MPTDAEIARLTLLPGFSTRDMVTEISGRGVGLDVVATRLRALAGTIDIRSRQGQGMSIELRFQASLVATTRCSCAMAARCSASPATPCSAPCRPWP